MKINCDVCNKHEASVFCSADDATLCSACDHRVHHASMLTGKHVRFSLLQPSPKDSPLCDICQGKKAFLFCQEDRAILCKDCDVSIHKVNEHTMNHCRFLLTGVKLSPAALSPTTVDDVVPIVNQTCSKTQMITSFTGGPKSNGSGHGCVTASSISEYLIETLPGWHVEDFLDSPPTYFSKVCEDDPEVFWGDGVFNGSMNDYFSTETMGMWVPQAPSPAAPPPPPRFHNSYEFQPCSNNIGMISGSSIVFAPSKMTKYSNGKRRSDDGNSFTVPQIGPPTTTTFKKSRTLT